AFSKCGWSAEVWAGDGADWSYEAALRARDSGVDAIFGAGGDGQLARILPAVAHTETALGVVPLGTGNVWARELGLPLKPELAIARQLASVPRRVDVGRANDRMFLVLASAGLDARIVEVIEHEAGPKGLGQLAYPLVGLGVGLSMRGAQTRVWLDDEPPLDLDLLACMVSNGRLYGGVLPLLPTAQVDDGLLDVVLFPGANPFDAGGHAVRVLAGLHHLDPKVIIRQVSRVRLETRDGEIPVQSDGDPLGTTPLDVEVLPGALLALGYPTSDT
ncbi:MAG TPA: diacylglycerol kinase family protein, partial [Chloroflexota bacterium]